jgi:hypothetical protein
MIKNMAADCFIIVRAFPDASGFERQPCRNVIRHVPKPAGFPDKPYSLSIFHSFGYTSARQAAFDEAGVIYPGTGPGAPGNAAYMLITHLTQKMKKPPAAWKTRTLWTDTN